MNLYLAKTYYSPSIYTNALHHTKLVYADSGEKAEDVVYGWLSELTHEGTDMYVYDKPIREVFHVEVEEPLR